LEPANTELGWFAPRIAEIVLRDERDVVPIGVYNSKLGVTFSLPGVVVGTAASKP